MYKVFINDSSLEFLEKPMEGKDSLIVYESKDQLEGYIEKLEKSPEILHFSFITDNLNKVWEDFNLHYKIIEAAGGIVRNADNEILMIYRLNKWDLPKGKLEHGESVEEGAIREVVEECGISGLQIIKPLSMTYHTYKINGQPILKRTYWFEMKTEHRSALIPQIEEHIEKAQWVNPDFLDEYLGNTFASVHWLLVNSKDGSE